MQVEKVRILASKRSSTFFCFSSVVSIANRVSLIKISPSYFVDFPSRANFHRERERIDERETEQKKRAEKFGKARGKRKKKGIDRSWISIGIVSRIVIRIINSTHYARGHWTIDNILSITKQNKWRKIRKNKKLSTQHFCDFNRGSELCVELIPSCELWYNTFI